MATYYVNPDATGAADGSSFANGYTSVNAVFSARTLSAADTIELDGGTSGKSYTVGSTAIINVGTNDVGFTIKGSSEVGHDGTVTIDGSTGTVHGIYLPADIAANTVTFEKMTVKAGAAKNCALLRAQCVFNDVVFDGSLTSGGSNFPVDISGAYTFTFNRSPIINTGAARLVAVAGDAQVTWSYSPHKGQTNAAPLNAVYVSDSGAAARSTFTSYNNDWIDMGAGLFATNGAYADVLSKNDMIVSLNNAAAAANTRVPFYAATSGDTIKLYNAIIVPGARVPAAMTGGSGTVTIDATCKQYLNPLFRANKHTGRVAVTIDSSDKAYIDDIVTQGNTYSVPISIAVYQYGLLYDGTYKWADTEAEVKTLMLTIQAQGHEFVNHTISHPHLGDSEAFKATYSGGNANPKIVVAGEYPNLIVSAVTDAGTDVGPLDVINTSYDTVLKVRLAINAHADWATDSGTNAVSGTKSKGLKIAQTAVGESTSIPLDVDTNYHHWRAEIEDMTTWLESFLGANSTKAFIIPFATRTEGLDYTADLQTWLAANIAATHCNGARTMQYAEGSDPVSTLRYANLYGASNATNRMGIGTIPTSLIVSGGTGSTTEATIRNNARAVFLWAAETGNPVVLTGHGSECSATEMGYILDELSKSGTVVMRYGDLVEWLVTAEALTDASDYRLKSGSPAINAGTDVSLTTDYLGKPTKNPPSIGAYEYFASKTRHSKFASQYNYFYRRNR